MTSPSGTPGQVDPEPSNNSHNKSIDNTQTETANTTKEEKTVDDEQIIKTKTSEIAESCKVTATVPTNNNRCIQSTNSKGNKISCLYFEN